MNRLIFAWESPGSELRQPHPWLDALFLLGLLIAALVLFGFNLNEPFLTLEEANLARLAQTVDFRFWQESGLSNEIMGSSPMIALIALLYQKLGVHSWTTRLPSALLSAVSVLLLYYLAKEVFNHRRMAFYAALVYLTCLPILLSGRLGSFNGIGLCEEIFILLAVLRSRRDLRWALALGLGLSSLVFSQMTLIFPLVLILLIFLAWDTPRLLTSSYFWSGILLGSLPGLVKLLYPWLQTGEKLVIALEKPQWLTIPDSLVIPNVSLDLGLILLVFSFPGLLFAVVGWRRAWGERNWSWAKFSLVGTGVLVLVLPFIPVQFFTSYLLLTPFFALLGGKTLAEVHHVGGDRAIPAFWSSFLFLAAILSGIIATSIYFDFFPFGMTLLEVHRFHLLLFLAALSLTFIATGILMVQKNLQFIPTLLWGMYVSLMVWVSSPFWIWGF